ncbi:MAG: hypothetical protein HW406_2453 [Candidatus Brocadiaceae bacterium]|nr:hypothetical protein [Candidatus Brocadiaceae bacterium]
MISMGTIYSKKGSQSMKESEEAFGFTPVSITIFICLTFHL